MNHESVIMDIYEKLQEQILPELETLFNKTSLDAVMNVPDFILARFVIDNLKAFYVATAARDECASSFSKAIADGKLLS